VWLGAQAIHSIILALLPFLESVDVSLGAWMGLSLIQLVSFVGFLAVHMVFVYKGIESMKVFEVVTAPLLAVSALALLIWAWSATGSLSAMLEVTNQFETSPDSTNSPLARSPSE
jgi:NCS1 family nucleobase:cation symporter-1